MKKIFNLLLSENGYIHFAAIALFYMLINYITNEFVLTESVMYNSFYGQIPEQFIEQTIEFQKKWTWVAYVIHPLILLLKWSFITAFVAMGSVFMGYSIGFRQTFKSIMSCEWLFILFGIVNLMVLLLSDVNSIVDVEQLNVVNTLSVGYLFKTYLDIEGIAKPLYSLNLLQVFYILLMPFSIGVISNKNYLYDLSLVLRTYAPALFIWIILITYITVSYA